VHGSELPAGLPLEPKPERAAPAEPRPWRPYRYPVIFRCRGCGLGVEGRERGWVGVVDDEFPRESEVRLYCPECAVEEFAP
jgi:hypothetical protein